MNARLTTSLAGCKHDVHDVAHGRPMTVADRHRAEAQRLRLEAAEHEREEVFGVEIWRRLADMHENIAERLDDVTDTQSDLPAFEG